MVEMEELVLGGCAGGGITTGPATTGGPVKSYTRQKQRTVIQGERRQKEEKSEEGSQRKKGTKYINL